MFLQPVRLLSDRCLEPCWQEHTVILEKPIPCPIENVYVSDIIWRAHNTPDHLYQFHGCLQFRP